MIEDLSLREGVEFEFIPSRFFVFSYTFEYIYYRVNDPQFYEDRC